MTNNKPPTIQEEALVSELIRQGVRVETNRRFSYFKSNGRRGYIKPDLCIPELGLVIEVDGLHHSLSYKQQNSDLKRDNTIREHGWDVQHVPNITINNPSFRKKFVNSIRRRIEDKNEESVRNKALIEEIERTRQTRKQSVTKLKGKQESVSYHPEKVVKGVKRFYPLMFIGLILLGTLPFFLEIIRNPSATHAIHVVVLGLMFSGLVFLMPTIIALKRNHKHQVTIILINMFSPVFLFFVLPIWLVLLIYALVGNKK